MDLAPYLADVRDQLAVAAAAGGEDARALAERLSAPLDAAIRLALLDALSAATAEITQEMAPGSVELRLRGRDPEFAVRLPAAPPAASPESSPSEAWSAEPSAAGDDATMTRINLRLSQDLKDRVEEAARQTGISVNAWLVRSASAALSAGPASPGPTRAYDPGGDHYRGWVR